MRILVVSQMYPGRTDPDLGVFVAQLVEAPRGLPRSRCSTLPSSITAVGATDGATWSSGTGFVGRNAPTSSGPTFLSPPAGLIATSVEAPLVVTAHGRDVRNVGLIPGIAALTRRVVRRAAAVIAVSHYLRQELELRVPEARGEDVGGRLRGRSRALCAGRGGRDHRAPDTTRLCGRRDAHGAEELRSARGRPSPRLDRGSLTFVGDFDRSGQVSRGVSASQSWGDSRMTLSPRTFGRPTSSARHLFSSRSDSRSSKGWRRPSTVVASTSFRRPA